MVLKKEYRICMPLTVEEYKIGQLYMIARHSHEESVSGDGIEVVHNRPCEDPVYGAGQYTEKKLHLSNRLPFWIQSFLPRVFYVIEKSWNYYPYTITEYACSFIQRFHILIKTKFQDDNGSSENCLELTPEELNGRTVEYLDIAYDEISARKYKEEEDPRYFQSQKTGRGPLVEGWRFSSQPIMCSYKFVQVSFEVWGLQSKVEDLIHRSIQEVLLVGHRQAFTWIDEWYGMSLEDVRIFENQMHKQTNEKVMQTEAAAEGKETTERTSEERVENPEGVEGTSNVANGLESPKTKVCQFGWQSKRPQHVSDRTHPKREEGETGLVGIKRQLVNPDNIPPGDMLESNKNVRIQLTLDCELLRPVEAILKAEISAQKPLFARSLPELQNCLF